jgi:hypothetical protein
LRDPLQIERANIRAKAVAEIDEAIPSLEIRPAPLLAILIGERERPADRRAVEVRLGAKRRHCCSHHLRAASRRQAQESPINRQ